MPGRGRGVRNRAANINGRSWTRFVPIEATGGTEQVVEINGVEYREHYFSGNEDYWFEVTSLGDTSGLVEYEIIHDGTDSTPSDDGDPSETAYMEGRTLRKIAPFTGEGPIFTYISNHDASDKSWEIRYSEQDQNLRHESEYNTSDGDSDGCVVGTNFEAALETYFNVDARMPTKEEYINNTLRGSGCGHDSHSNWTATKDLEDDDDSQHYYSPGRNPFDGSDVSSGSTDGVQLTSNSNTQDNRAVIDADTDRPDPNILQDQVVFDKLQEYDWSVIEEIDGPRVEAGVEYDLTLGTGPDDAIPNTGPQQSDSNSGQDNNGDVVVRYPLERVREVMG